MAMLDRKGLAAPLQNLTPASALGLDLTGPSGCGPSGLAMNATTLPWK